MQGNRISILIFSALVLICGLLVINLFVLRFEKGNIYPPYSSFRTDPLGGKAFYEALHHFDTLTVKRHFQPLEQIAQPALSCVILSGMISDGTLLMPKKTIDTIMEQATSGCRFVIAVTPARQGLQPGEKEALEEEKAPPENDQSTLPEQDEPEKNPFQLLDLFEKMGVTLKQNRSSRDDSHAGPGAGLIRQQVMFPAFLWPQKFYFEISGTGWTPICDIQSKRTVIIEKSFGSGSIVLLSDSYIFSNESLKRDHTAPLLKWILGSQPRVLFDEYHLGVHQRRGISNLIRDYGLAWPAGLFGIFVLLLMWRWSASLLPPGSPDPDYLDPGNLGPDRPDETGKPARNTGNGLTNLLKQHIPENKLVLVCLDTWESTVMKENRMGNPYRRNYQEIQSILSPEAPGNKKKYHRKNKSKQAVRDYQEICRILTEKEDI